MCVMSAAYLNGFYLDVFFAELGYVTHALAEYLIGSCVIEPNDY